MKLRFRTGLVTNSISCWVPTHALPWKARVSAPYIYACTFIVFTCLPHMFILMLTPWLSRLALASKLPKVVYFSSPPFPFFDYFIHAAIFFCLANYLFMGLELMVVYCWDCYLWCIRGGTLYLGWHRHLLYKEV